MSEYRPVQRPQQLPDRVRDVALVLRSNRQRELPRLLPTCRPIGISWFGRNGTRLRCSIKAGGVLWVATSAQGIAIPTEDVAEVGVTDARGILQHGREHRLKIAGRAADNLKYLGGSRLLL